MGIEKMNRALLIAFHYPPARGSSGIQRTLNFSRYLPENGWEPIVLSAQEAAYPETSDGQLGDIPERIVVKRAFALDTARHLSIGGRYIGAMAYPDRWVSWWLGGVASGLKLIRKHKPDVIWSTYPIATAHLIAYTLHRLTSVPWVADFRDSMTEDNYPTDPKKRAVYRWIERRAVKYAARSVFTSPGAIRMYQERYPDIPADKWTCILNGYDEENFTQAEARLAAVDKQQSGPLVLLHSGLLYPSERDPREFFAAVAELKKAGQISSARLIIRLRASGYEALLQSLIDEVAIGDIVKLEPPVSYGEALTEMLSVDGLLIFQAKSCNHQIPAKLYEYIRARKPILALTDPAGDTAALLRQSGVFSIAQLDSCDAIKESLQKLLSSIETDTVTLSGDDVVARYSRRSQSGELADLLNTLKAR